LDYKIPEEDFTCEKPNIENLRIYGCHVYVHVPKDKRTKLESYGKKGTFVGYSENSNAFRFYEPR